MEYAIGSGVTLVVVWMSWVSYMVIRLRAAAEVSQENAEILADGLNAIANTEVEPGDYDGDSEMGFHNG